METELTEEHIIGERMETTRYSSRQPPGPRGRGWPLMPGWRYSASMRCSSPAPTASGHPEWAWQWQWQWLVHPWQRTDTVEEKIVTVLALCNDCHLIIWCEGLLVPGARRRYEGRPTANIFTFWALVGASGWPGHPRPGLGYNDEDNNVYVYRVTQIIDHW